MTPDPWAFGWTQLLTIIGFGITVSIAVGGFQTFGRWRRQQIEERRIDIAFEALSIAQESKFIFDRIRASNGSESEWRSMAIKPGETEQDRAMRGGSYAILVRMEAARDYFERVSRLQPKAIAVFGTAVERAFERLNRAAGYVHESAIELIPFPHQSDLTM